MKPELKKLFPLTCIAALFFVPSLGFSGEQLRIAATQDEIIVRVRQMGDHATASNVWSEVMKLKSASQFEKIKLVEKINTEPARSTLLEMAMGNYIDKESIAAARAADAYVRLLNDKNMATNLLKSTNRDVLFSALAALEGCKVDEDIMKQLIPKLESDDIDVRISILSVIFHSQTPLTEKSIQSVVDSMRSINGISGATNIIPVTLIDSCSGLRNFETQASRAYGAYIPILANAPDETLKKLTPMEPEEIRDVIVIARAKKKNSLLKEELKQIFHNSKLSGLRTAALSTFCLLATKNDLPFLQDIASKDSSGFEPFGQIKDYLESYGFSSEKYFPFRKLAQKYLWKIAPTHSGPATPEESGYPSIF